MGDDDDVEDGGSEEIWKRFFTKPYEEAAAVVSTKKENGAAAHMAAMKIGGKYFLLGGSKNVHIIAASREHLKLYPQEQRFSVACKVPILVFMPFPMIRVYCPVITSSPPPQTKALSFFLLSLLSLLSPLSPIYYVFFISLALCFSYFILPSK